MPLLLLGYVLKSQLIRLWFFLLLSNFLEKGTQVAKLKINQPITFEFFNQHFSALVPKLVVETEIVFQIF